MKVSVSVLVFLLVCIFDNVHCQAVQPGALVFSSLDTAATPSPITDLTPPLGRTDTTAPATAAVITYAPVPLHDTTPVHSPKKPYGFPKPPTTECTTSKCKDTMLVPSHSFETVTIVDDVTKAVVKNILVQSTFTDVVEELITVPVCQCTTTTVPLTQTFTSMLIPMILEGCSPTYSEARITTLDLIRGDTVTINDCTAEYHQFTVPRLTSTVVDDWVNTFVFTSTQVAKTIMEPVQSETKLTVCTATCEEKSHEYPPRNRYLPPAPYHG